MNSGRLGKSNAAKVIQREVLSDMVTLGWKLSDVADALYKPGVGVGAACVEALELGYSGNCRRRQWRVDTGGKQRMQGRQGHRGPCMSQ